MPAPRSSHRRTLLLALLAPLALCLLQPPSADAAPDAAFAWSDTELIDRQYVRVVGDGPVWGRYRRRRGNVRAALFPNGVIEHYDQLERSERVARHLYDGAGRPWTSATWAEDRPVAVTVHRPAPQEIDVSAWTAQDVGALHLWLPAPPVEQLVARAGAVWRGEDWTLAAEWRDGGGDVFGDAARDALRDACACVLLDRATAWVDGQPSARYLAEVPTFAGAWRGEVWLVPRGERRLVLWFLTAPDADAATTAWGRAAVGLAEWRDE